MAHRSSKRSVYLAEKALDETKRPELGQFSTIVSGLDEYAFAMKRLHNIPLRDLRWYSAQIALGVLPSPSWYTGNVRKTPNWFYSDIKDWRKNS